MEDVLRTSDLNIQNCIPRDYCRMLRNHTKPKQAHRIEQMEKFNSVTLIPGNDASRKVLKIIQIQQRRPWHNTRINTGVTC